jgi:DNA topoisomerase I
MKTQLTTQEYLLIDPGYRLAYEPPASPATGQLITPEKSRLTKMKKGQRMQLRRISVTRQKPASGLTEAELVRMLQTHGVGRPATYDGIIENLVERRYVCREPNGILSPTARGRDVCEFLVKEYPHLFNPGFTSRMETRLDLITTGKASYAETLQFIWELLEKKK